MGQVPATKDGGPVVFCYTIPLTFSQVPLLDICSVLAADASSHKHCSQSYLKSYV